MDNTSACGGDGTTSSGIHVYEYIGRIRLVLSSIRQQACSLHGSFI